MWVKVDDQFPDHIKLARLGRYTPLCGWLYVCGLAFCNRQLTDGRIPKLKIHSLTSFVGLGIETGCVPGMATVGEDVDITKVAHCLVAVGLWEEDEQDYIVHDYLDFQPSRDEVIAERNAAIARRERHRWNGSGDVRPNVTRTSPDVRPNVALRSPAPDPDPEDQDQDPPRTPPPEVGAALQGNRRRKRPNPGEGSTCPHEPTCASITACVNKALTDGRAARAKGDA